MFKFDLNQVVDIRVSGEWGHVKSRADSISGVNQYQVHYKAADGRVATGWFDENDLVATEDDRHPGAPVYVCNAEDVPEDAVIHE